MRYRREAPFRYTFEEPLAALFKIKAVDGEEIESSKGEVKIVDISTEGMKINTHLNIPEIDNKSIHLSISFELNEKQMAFTGMIVWKKEIGSTNNYGIDLLTDETEREKLVDELKIYSRKHLK